MKAVAAPIDFVLSDHASIRLLQPLTALANVWITEHLPVDNPETQFWRDAIVIEPRYVEAIALGIHEGGLVVR